MKKSNHKIILLEDDALLAETIQSTFSDFGSKCSCYNTIQAAEHLISGKAPDVLIADLVIPAGNNSKFSNLETRSGFTGGVAFIREAKKKWKKTKFVLITGQPSVDVSDWARDNKVDYLLKPISRAKFERYATKHQIKAFVVHGRDKKNVSRIKRILKQLKIVPIVLMEQPSKGKTVIEKFEEVASKCDCAIVTFSPDDFGKLVGEPASKGKLRVRQNVLFELGYFYASFQRNSGRVVMVQFGDVEIPSDLAGIIRLDGNQPMKKLAEELRTELIN